MLEVNALVAPNTTLRGKFTADQNSSFDLSGEFDSLYFGNQRFYQSAFEFTSAKNQDSTECMFDFVLQSAFQELTSQEGEPLLSTEQLDLRANLNDKQMAYNVFVNQRETANKLNLTGNFALLLPQGYELSINPSEILLAGDKWTNPQRTDICIDGKEIKFNNFLFTNGEDHVAVYGEVSEDNEKRLFLSIKDLEIEAFSGLLGKKLGGVMNGNISFAQLYKPDLKLEYDVTITGASLENFPIGHIYNTGKWNAQEKLLMINSYIQTDSVRTVALLGSYATENKKDPLSVNIQLKQLEVRLLEPFLSDIMSEFGGKATGNLHLKGHPARPIVTGDIFVRKGKFKVNYLNTRYFFDDKIYFQKNKIAFKRMKLRDGKGQTGFIDGGILHNGFQDFALDIKGDFKKFKLLDTKLAEDALYYGTAVGTGNIEMKTKGNDLLINVRAKSEKGTKIYLAMDGYSAAEKKEFVNFVEFAQKKTATDSTRKFKPSVPKIDLSRLLMTLDMEITPDAHMEIIFDKRTGDIIRGTGKGKVSMNIDTKGDFQMFGNVEIVKGAYNFTFQNLFNKEFEIAQGSTLSWNGDPLGGLANIKAQYFQAASLAPIIQADSSVLKRPEIRRRYPVRLDLFIKGEIMKPEIKFDINILNYPSTIVAGSVPVSLDTYVNAFRTRMANDEQELNRQVFSLILLKQFSPQGSFSGIGQSAAGSVSELLTNQLSHWMSQVDDNLEVNIDLNGLNKDALNTFQLRLSYSFLNGRVRVTRDGSFTNVQNRTNASSVIGDWTVEYMITKDGKLRLKMFRRSNTAVLGTNLNATASTTGASLLYVKSFNSFKDLLFPKRKRNRKTQKDKRGISERDDTIHITN